MRLPIHDIQDEILARLRAGNRLVLTAPTGSGKTTQVPQMLLHAAINPGWIVVLQPRRLATRLVAERVASELGTKTGQLIGYQTRHDSRVSAQTQVRFMTEGLFVRMLQNRPRLDEVGTVILDEFHERSLAADTALAMVRRLQETQRPDLRLIVMSATLDAQKVATYLNAPALSAHGRTYPVDVQYLARRVNAPPWDLAADAVEQVLSTQDEGDVLVFMPGRYEIRRTVEACSRLPAARGCALLPLHGELPPREQDAALAPRSQRRVIVSTNVAETSITIEGIRHVIDSGLARVNRFDPRRGINVLLVEPISRSSADQRAGRAGRTAAGTCLRLWPENEHRSREGHDTPEVQRLDLAEVLLQLRAMGVGNVREFAWLEPPPELAVQQAESVLSMLGAVDAKGELTAIGKQMAELPMHPRLSRLLVEASRQGVLERATLWAALLSERDILIREQKSKHAEKHGENEDFLRTDFTVLEAALAKAEAVGFDPGRCASLGIQGNACRELVKTRELYREACSDARWARQAARQPARKLDDGHEQSILIKCLLTGHADHVAMRRSGDNLACALVGGRRGELDPASVAKHVGPILALDIREVGTGTAASGGAVRTVLSLCSELDMAWLEEVLPAKVRRESVTVWTESKRAVERYDRLMFDDLVLDEKLRPESQINPGDATAILAEQIVRGNLRLARWDEAVEQWIERTRCVSKWFPERKMIGYEPDDLSVILQEICTGAVRFSQVEDRPCLQAVKDALSWEDQRFVEHMAPERMELPRGYRMKVTYQVGSSPKGRAKIQDFYGLEQTPTVAAGRQRVVLEILGPNFRPLQVTEDLAGFWKNLYPVLRKELARKYPRHSWR